MPAPGPGFSAPAKVRVRVSRASLALSSTMPTANRARMAPAGTVTTAGAEKSASAPLSAALPLNDNGTPMAPPLRPDNATVNCAAPALSLTTPPPLMLTVTGSEAAMVACAVAKSGSTPPASGAVNSMVTVSAPSFNASSAMATAKLRGAESVNTSRPEAVIKSAAPAAPAAPAPAINRQVTAAGASAVGGRPTVATVNRAMPPSATATPPVARRRNRRGVEAGRYCTRMRAGVAEAVTTGGGKLEPRCGGVLATGSANVTVMLPSPASAGPGRRRKVTAAEISPGSRVTTPPLGSSHNGMVPRASAPAAAPATAVTVYGRLMSATLPSAAPVRRNCNSTRPPSTACTSAADANSTCAGSLSAMTKISLANSGSLLNEVVAHEVGDWRRSARSAWRKVSVKRRDAPGSFSWLSKKRKAKEASPLPGAMLTAPLAG